MPFLEWGCLFSTAKTHQFNSQLQFWIPYYERPIVTLQLHELNSSISWIHYFKIMNSWLQPHEFEISIFQLYDCVISPFWISKFRYYELNEYNFHLFLNSSLVHVVALWTWSSEFVKIKLWNSWIYEAGTINSWCRNCEVANLKL